MSAIITPNLTTPSLPKEHATGRPVLKCGDMFALFDTAGSFRSGLHEEGLYFDGTRFLSKKYIQVNGLSLSMMGAQVRSDGEELFVTYGNIPDAIPGLLEHSLSITERMFLSGESCYAEIVVANFSSTVVALSLSIHLDADYADIYEVRGMRRKARGALQKPQVSGEEIVLSYVGLDQEMRSTQISFAPPPSQLGSETAEFKFNLAEGES
ncbi:MAG TPA: glycogen debranching N-terminal domain-containing protein, partial [Edaphobacter sp.]|nr:glycogen debranching N-terminal domain-containing protein [Edaphobacter sp.]